MLVSFARTTLQVIRAAMVSDHGTSVENWDTPTTRSVAGCLVDTAPGRTDPTHRDGVETDLTVLMPPGSDVNARDRIRVPGYSRDFTIVDGPRFQPSPTGRLDQIWCSLRVLEG